MIKLGHVLHNFDPELAQIFQQGAGKSTPDTRESSKGRLPILAQCVPLFSISQPFPQHSQPPYLAPKPGRTMYDEQSNMKMGLLTKSTDEKGFVEGRGIDLESLPFSWR